MVDTLQLVLNLLDILKVLFVILNAFILFYIVYFKKIEKQNENEIENFLNKRKNIALIIAHPDDESMFFTPFITSVSSHSNIHLLCLSSGDFDGIGETRKKELEKSTKFLNIKTLKIIEDEMLKDGMKNKWDKEIIVSHIKTFTKEFGIELVSFIIFNLFRLLHLMNMVFIFQLKKESLAI
jgi:N-acetylglucosaminylphosphatidylinositol deacetylase